MPAGPQVTAEPQTTAENHAMVARPATGPSLSRAAASRPVASSALGQVYFGRPATSRPPVSLPAISSHMATSSPMDHVAQPITPPSIDTDMVTPPTPSRGGYVPLSRPVTPSVGSPMSAPGPIGIASTSRPLISPPVSRGHVIAPFTHTVFTPIVQSDSSGPTIFKHSTGPFTSCSLTPSPTPQARAELHHMRPAQDLVGSDAETTQPKMRAPRCEGEYGAGHQTHRVAKPSAQCDRRTLHGRQQTRRLRQQGST